MPVIRPTRTARTADYVHSRCTHACIELVITGVSAYRFLENHPSAPIP